MLSLLCIVCVTHMNSKTETKRCIIQTDSYIQRVWAGELVTVIITVPPVAAAHSRYTVRSVPFLDAHVALRPPVICRDRARELRNLSRVGVVSVQSELHWRTVYLGLQLAVTARAGARNICYSVGLAAP